jgi:cell wall-associated NlpC family hydrolase
VPAWFWTWRLYRLARATRKGSAAWKAYNKAVAAAPDPVSEVASHRALLVRWAKWGVAKNAQIHYTESTARDDYLHRPKGSLPISTDCSGWVTYCYWSAGLPDPSGLNYAYLGYTGTLLANAYKHGKVLTNLALAKPGDPIVIGPGTGWHVTICVQSGVDPIVVSHGSEPGPLSEHQSYDHRTPKRVCQILP